MSQVSETFCGAGDGSSRVGGGEAGPSWIWRCEGVRGGPTVPEGGGGGGRGLQGAAVAAGATSELMIWPHHVLGLLKRNARITVHNRCVDAMGMR